MNNINKNSNQVDKVQFHAFVTICGADKNQINVYSDKIDMVPGSKTQCRNCGRTAGSSEFDFISFKYGDTMHISLDCAKCGSSVIEDLFIS